MAKVMRLVFMGSDGIALPMLERLADEGRAVVEIVGVFTQPDRPVGRGQRVVANAIKTWAMAAGVPVYQPEKFDDDARQQLAFLEPDVTLVMAYGHILRLPVIETPRLGTLNLHTSLLPRYRGASPIQTAIASGERETGVSLMRIVPALDAGPVADVERVAVGSLDTALDVEAKLAEASATLVWRNLPKLAAGSLRFHPQDESRVTFCRRLSKEDGALDFSRAAAELAARINGLFPWPTCQVMIGDTPVKFGRADTLSESAGGSAAGSVVGADENGLLIATGSGTLRVRQLQRPGGKMLAAADFLRGFPIATGTRLPSSGHTVLVGARPLR